MTTQHGEEHFRVNQRLKSWMLVLMRVLMPMLFMALTGVRGVIGESNAKDCLASQHQYIDVKKMQR